MQVTPYRYFGGAVVVRYASRQFYDAIYGNGGTEGRYGTFNAHIHITVIESRIVGGITLVVLR